MTLDRYEPRGAVRELFTCRDTEVLVEGPAGTGKTRGLLEKQFVCAVKYPGSRHLAIRKTRASMTESVLVTLEQKVIPKNPRFYPDVTSVHRRNRQSYDFPNGSSIVVGGMDNPDRIMSTEYDTIYAFEGTELMQPEWEALLTRLRNGKMPYQQGVVDVNPGATTHWLNQRAAGGLMTRLRSRHHDNPMLFDGGDWTDSGRKYISVLERLSGVRRVRLLEGKWATAEGVVYPDFDPLVHVIKPFDIPNEWRKIRSIDFGYTNPFVCGWWAIDPDGRMIKYREVYGTGKLVEDWAKIIIALTGQEVIEATISDHDREDRETLHRHGVPTIPAYKPIEVGIQAVESRLRKAGDGRPRMMFFENCTVEKDESLANQYLPTCTVQEFESYIYKPGMDGKPIKEEPLDMNNHGMDETRYCVAYVDNISHPPASVHVHESKPVSGTVPILVNVNTGSRGGWR